MLVNVYDWTIESILSLEACNRITRDDSIKTIYNIEKIDKMIVEGLLPYAIVLNQKITSNNKKYYSVIQGQELLNALVKLNEDYEVEDYDMFSNFPIRTYIVINEQDKSIKRLLEM